MPEKAAGNVNPRLAENDSADVPVLPDHEGEFADLTHILEIFVNVLHQRKLVDVPVFDLPELGKHRVTESAGARMAIQRVYDGLLLRRGEDERPRAEIPTG